MLFERTTPTILKIIFKHSRFYEPLYPVHEATKDLHILALRQIIQFEWIDLIMRIKAINYHSVTAIKDNYFPSPAIVATTTFRQYDITKVLLTHVAPVDATDVEGTSLTTSVYYDDIAMARPLLEHGADPDPLDLRSYPPIFSASLFGMIHLLIDFEANLDTRNEIGCSFIH